MQRKTTCLTVLTVGLLLSTAAWAQHRPEYHFYVAPSFAYTHTPHSRATKDGMGAELAIGKHFTKYLDLEILGGWTGYMGSASRRAAVQSRQADAGLAVTPQPRATKRFSIGAGFNIYAFSSFDKILSGWGAPTLGGWFKNLYLHGDIRYDRTSSQPGLTTHHYHGTLFDAGLGYNLPLPFLSSGAALRLQAIYRLDQHNQAGVGLSGSSKNFDEIVGSVGLRIPFGKIEPKSANSKNQHYNSPVHVAPVAPATPPSGTGTEGAAAAPGGTAPGGAPHAGGAPPAGGMPPAGGAPAAGGAPPAGGTPPAGGAPPAGGPPNVGGSPPTGSAQTSSSTSSSPTAPASASSASAPPAGGAPAGGAPPI